MRDEKDSKRVTRYAVLGSHFRKLLGFLMLNGIELF